MDKTKEKRLVEETAEVLELMRVTKAKKLSQEAVARELGVTLNTVNRWFVRTHKPHPVWVEKIVRYLRKLDAD